MPCNSDYMEANGYEQAISRVACLLDELDGKPFNKDHWRGYHPAVYNRSNKSDGDGMVRTLCSRLQALDVTKQSLEMQMWWRDHQEADRSRLEAEAVRKKIKAAREEAISKLTPSERKVLGLE
jgi:hypothetical protein